MNKFVQFDGVDTCSAVVNINNICRIAALNIQGLNNTWIIKLQTTDGVQMRLNDNLTESQAMAKLAKYQEELNNYYNFKRI